MNVGVEIEDRVRLSQHEVHSRCASGREAVKQRTGPSLLTPPDRDRHCQRQEDRQGAELRRNGQSDRKAREQIARQPARLDGLDQKKKREQNEKRQRNIADREVGALDVEDRRGEQNPRQQAGPPPVKPGAQQRQEDDCRRPPERRKLAPREDDPVVTGEPRAHPREQGRDDPSHIQRKGTVGEEMRIELERDEGDPLDRHRDGPFIGMEEVTLVPSDPDEPDDRRKEKQRGERPAVAPDDRWHHFSRAKGTRISRAVLACLTASARAGGDPAIGCIPRAKAASPAAAE